MGNHCSKSKKGQQFGVLDSWKEKVGEEKFKHFPVIFFITSVTKTFIAHEILILRRK